jgi:hypothetical protein
VGGEKSLPRKRKIILFRERARSCDSSVRPCRHHSSAAAPCSDLRSPQARPRRRPRRPRRGSRMPSPVRGRCSPLRLRRLPRDDALSCPSACSHRLKPWSWRAQPLSSS